MIKVEALSADRQESVSKGKEIVSSEVMTRLSAHSRLLRRFTPCNDDKRVCSIPCSISVFNLIER